MSDDLKNMYLEAGKSDAFYEGATPIELFRAKVDPILSEKFLSCYRIPVM